MHMILLIFSCHSRIYSFMMKEKHIDLLLLLKIKTLDYGKADDGIQRNCFERWKCLNSINNFDENENGGKKHAMILRDTMNEENVCPSKRTHLLNTILNCKCCSLKMSCEVERNLYAMANYRITCKNELEYY